MIYNSGYNAEGSGKNIHPITSIVDGKNCEEKYNRMVDNGRI